VKDRYVISVRRRTGLGDRLICLAAAWRFARDTGRVLVADWRFSPYALDPKANLFALCFETPAELAGVPFIGDDGVASMGLPGEPQEARRQPLPASYRRIAHKTAGQAIRESRDLPSQIVEFNTCVNDGLTLVKDSRVFLESLKPVAPISQAVTPFRQALPPGPVIGLHIRHGNGGDILGHARHWTSFPAAINRCVGAVEAAQSRLGNAATVMLCTDSIEVEQAIRELLPAVVCRPKMYRHPNDGELHLWRGAGLGRDDGMVEMLLLAESDALIRYPPASFFSFYGAVMKPHREPERWSLYDLQRPWDSGDVLSPALIW
jgi:nodulation protein Z